MRGGSGVGGEQSDDEYTDAGPVVAALRARGARGGHGGVPGRPALAVWGADNAALSAFTTVFLSIVLQATPFLVLGVLLSAAINAFVSPRCCAGRCPAIRCWRSRWPGAPVWRCPGASARRYPLPAG